MSRMHHSRFVTPAFIAGAVKAGVYLRVSTALAGRAQHRTVTLHRRFEWRIWVGGGHLTLAAMSIANAERAGSYLEADGSRRAATPPHPACIQCMHGKCSEGNQSMSTVKTSESDPIRIAAVTSGRDHGRIGVTLCPGKTDPRQKQSKHVCCFASRATMSPNHGKRWSHLGERDLAPGTMASRTVERTLRLAFFDHDPRSVDFVLLVLRSLGVNIPQFAQLLVSIGHIFFERSDRLVRGEFARLGLDYRIPRSD